MNKWLGKNLLAVKFLPSVDYVAKRRIKNKLLNDKNIIKIKHNKNFQ